MNRRLVLAATILSLTTACQGQQAQTKPKESLQEKPKDAIQEAPAPDCGSSCAPKQGCCEAPKPEAVAPQTPVTTEVTNAPEVKTEKSTVTP
jgi:hypothetical protein